MGWVSCYGCNGRGCNEIVRSYRCPRCNGERTIAIIHQIRLHKDALLLELGRLYTKHVHNVVA